MASVAYNFMTVDSNAHHRRYSNSGHDTGVSVDVLNETSSIPRSAKKRTRKKSSASVVQTNHKKFYGFCSCCENRPLTCCVKVKVQVCVQFFKVGEIDTLKEQYTADVIVRARWREPSLDGQIQSAGDIQDFQKYWNPKLYIENTIGDPKEILRHRLTFNNRGECFVSEKRIIKGTFMENLELDNFPFDVQDLTVTVASEFPSYEVEIVEDSENRHMVNRQSFVDEQEWHLYVHTECEKKAIVIDQADNSVKRSAVSVKCRAARRPGYFVWNIFMVTFLICSLAFATFSVEKDLPQNRLQLSFTLVLTAVAFKSVVNQSLPRISYLTYMDKYLLTSMVMLSTVCAWHGIVTTLLKDREHADKVEVIVLSVLVALYILYNAGFMLAIYVVPYKKRRIMAQKDREYKILHKSP
nr:GABAA Receptor rho subunit [Haliotis diversicolor]